MIKTECGEMIEPRVGDVVLGMGRRLTITTDGQIERGSIGYENTHYTMKYVQLESCTLLHRPFQAGDFLQRKDGESANVVDLLSDEGLADYQHTNPAWRDHSEYTRTHQEGEHE